MSLKPKEIRMQDDTSLIKLGHEALMLMFWVKSSRGGCKHGDAALKLQFGPIK